jgi:hypothetical protein
VTEILSRPASRGLSRRNLLRLAAASAPVIAGLSLAPSASAAVARPTGAAYVRYEDLYKAGDNLQAVINKVTGNRILTLPEGEFTVKDFRNGEKDGIRIGTGPAAGCRGLVGSGRNTVIRVAANTATRDMGNGICGNQMQIAGKPNAVLSQFSLKGYPQKAWYYAGLVVSGCNGAKLSNLYLRGASRGWSMSPPGETFGINIMRSDAVQIVDCEVDGRDDAGTRVAASPIGFNYATNVKVYRTYVHHGVASMMTFFRSTNIYTEDFHAFATSSGSGSKSGHGINHEQSGGVIKHVRPQLFINGRYSQVAGHSDSTGMHMMLCSTVADVPNFTVIDPVFDHGPSSTNMFCIAIYDGYTVAGVRNKIKSTPHIIKGGVTLKRSDHPAPGWGSKDPNQYFAIIH